MDDMYLELQKTPTIGFLSYTYVLAFRFLVYALS
jgi:hypothetical protein